MWILECDGDVLKDKRIWLRPGNKYLFGRTREQLGGKGGFVIAHKSVSRKHLTLSVAGVEAGHAVQVHSRPEITLHDEDTKTGTEIDGERVRGEERILRKNQHVLMLGKAEVTLKITWQPVVLTFAFGSKETKGGKDPLASIQSQLENTDIKLIYDYIIEATTHVVQGKRNTTKGLQALVNGKYIVTKSFVDALVYATTPGDLSEPESLSPLEEDFDTNWPDALEYLPPKSNEPKERPVEYFKPNPDRVSVFEGYTFVFCEKVQFNALHAPITNGGGKALVFDLKWGKTTSEDVVRYVKSVAGEKGLGELEDGSEGKGVVVVKVKPPEEYQAWAFNLEDEVAQHLDLRLIEQNEFMDAVLMNDASSLRRPLLPADPEDRNSDELRPTAQARPNLQAVNGTDAQPSAPPAETKPPPRRARTRGAVVSRFKGFDDGFDETETSKPSRIFAEDSFAAGVLEDKDPNIAMDIDSGKATNGETQSRSSRKRPAPSPDPDDFIDEMLPAQAALKRRRLEAEEEARRTGKPINTSFRKPEKAIEKQKPKPPKKEVNIQEAVRKRREAEEESARRDEELLRQNFGDEAVEQMKNLAVVEEMEVARRERPRQVNGERSDRWDERWNGRKNFKKFRRQRHEPQGRRELSKLVPLEEVKRKDFGIGEKYWETEGDKRGRKERERPGTQTTQSQPAEEVDEPVEESIEDESHHQIEVPSNLTDGNEHEVINVDAPRATRRTQNTQQSSSQSQARGGKRAAPDSGREAATKRQKLITVRDSDSDSEDELKFRKKRKR